MNCEKEWLLSAYIYDQHKTDLAKNGAVACYLFNNRFVDEAI